MRKVKVAKSLSPYVDELIMYIDNDGQLYRQQTTSIIKNILHKMIGGRYNHKLAPKLWLYLVDSGAKKYFKDMGGAMAFDQKGNATEVTFAAWNKMFPKKLRQEAAEFMADRFLENAQDGDYDPKDFGIKGKLPKEIKADADVDVHVTAMLAQRLTAFSEILAGVEPTLSIEAGLRFKKRKKRKSAMDKWLKKTMSGEKYKIKSPLSDSKISLWSFRIKPAKKRWRKWSAKARGKWEKGNGRFKEVKKELLQLWRKKHGDTKHTQHLSVPLRERHKFLKKMYLNKEVSVDYDDENGKKIKVKKPLKDVLKEIDKLPEKDRGDAYQHVFSQVNRQHSAARRKLIKSQGDKMFETGASWASPDGKGRIQEKKPLKEVLQMAIDRGDTALYNKVMKDAEKADAAEKKEKAIKKFEERRKKKQEQAIERHKGNIEKLLGDKAGSEKWQKRIDDAMKKENPVQEMFLLVKKARDAAKKERALQKAKELKKKRKMPVSKKKKVVVEEPEKPEKKPEPEAKPKPKRAIPKSKKKKVVVEETEEKTKPKVAPKRKRKMPVSTKKKVVVEEPEEEKPEKKPKAEKPAEEEPKAKPRKFKPRQLP